MQVNKKLLIVDDDARICRSIQRVAVNSGYDVRTLTDPNQFEDTLRDYTPRILFLDLNMPELDGIQLLQKMKDLKYYPDIYIMSGVDPSVLATSHRIANWEGIPLKGVMTKPLDWGKIIGLLAQPSENRNDQSTAPSPSVKHSPAIIEHELSFSEFDLTQAMQKHQISIKYQPKVDLISGKLVGAEALARWTHPTMGSIPPSLFIPFAEQHGLIKKLTFYIFSYAIADYRMLVGRIGKFKLSLNLSSLMLDDPNLPEEMADLFFNANIPCHDIILEITETAAYQDELGAMEILSRLRIKGFGLSIDDYGTGHSSLAKLLHIPFSELKMDRSFVADLLEDDDTRTLVESTLELAKKFNLKTVAEGIEDSETMRWLASKGCDEGQGYYLSHPVSAIKLIKWHLEKASPEILNGPQEDMNVLSLLQQPDSAKPSL